MYCNKMFLTAELCLPNDNLLIHIELCQQQLKLLNSIFVYERGLVVTIL